MSLLHARQDITDSAESPDSKLNALRNEPTDRTLPKDPTEPMENDEPIEPIDMNDPLEQTLKVESVEPMLHLELRLARIIGASGGE